MLTSHLKGEGAMLNFLKLIKIGTLVHLTSLIVLSPLFTNWFTDKVILYFLMVIAITIGNVVAELLAIQKRGEDPKKYIGLFAQMTLPTSLIILTVFVLV